MWLGVEESPAGVSDHQHLFLLGKDSSGQSPTIKPRKEVPQCELPVRMLTKGCPVAAPAQFASSAGKPFRRKET